MICAVAVPDGNRSFSLRTHKAVVSAAESLIGTSHATSTLDVPLCKGPKVPVHHIKAGLQIYDSCETITFSLQVRKSLALQVFLLH